MIAKLDFNAAVQAAIVAVKPLLLQVETDLSVVSGIVGPISAIEDLQGAVAALHAELANQLSVADQMGSTGGIHTDTGGGNKGVSE